MTYDSLAWYQESLEVLQPLRYHINELIQAVEAHNRYADLVGQPKVSPKTLEEAKQAANLAEYFFTGHT